MWYWKELVMRKKFDHHDFAFGKISNRNEITQLILEEKDLEYVLRNKSTFTYFLLKITSAKF